MAKESVRYDTNQRMRKMPHLLSVPLSQEERWLAEAEGKDVAQIEKEVDDFLKIVPQNPDVSLKDLLAAVATKQVRPAFKQLDDVSKGKYRASLDRHVNQMYRKATGNLSTEEVRSSLTRYFLDLLHTNDEFDFMITDHETSTFIQLEVKSYPQDNAPDDAGLQKALDAENDQL